MDNTKSTTDAQKFIELCRNDSELQAQLQNADETTILEAAKSHGLTIEISDLTQLADPVEEEVEISDQELDMVSGGASGVSCGLVCRTIQSAIDSCRRCNSAMSDGATDASNITMTRK